MSTNNKYTINDLETALNNAKAGIDVEKNQDIIIDSKNLYCALLFAIEVSNANIEKLQQLILDSDDCQYAYLFAIYIRDADIEKLSEVILKSKSNCYMYWFANEVEGVNIQKFIDVLKTRLPADDKYVVRLEKKLAKIKPIKTVQKAYVEAVSGKDFEENQKFIIDSGDLEFVHQFATALRFNGANIALLEQAIIDSTRSDKYEFAYYFANNIRDGANIEKLSDVVLSSNNSDLKIDFAKNVPGANIQKFIDNLKSAHNFSDTHHSIVKLKKILEEQKPVKTPKEAYDEALQGINVKENEQIVLNKKDSRLSYNFARNIPTADIKAHEKIVLESGRCDVSFSFAMTIPVADIQAHISLMNMAGKYGWELELKEKLKEIETNKLLEEDAKFMENLRKEELKKESLEEQAKIAYENIFYKKIYNHEDINKVIDSKYLFDFCHKIENIPKDFINTLYKKIEQKAIESGDHVACMSLIDYHHEDCSYKSLIDVIKTHGNPEDIYWLYDICPRNAIPFSEWIDVIPKNNDIAINFLFDFITFKSYGAIDFLKEKHPEIICVDYLTKNVICTDDYSDYFKVGIQEAITYLNSKNKPEPIKETNWLRENAIEGIYQGISQTVVKNLTKSIIELLKLNKIDEPSIYLAEKFLSSTIGISILLALVGAGIHFIPAKLTQDNIHIQKVGDKCIQSCTAIGSEHLINLAMNFVLPAITNAICSNKQISVMEILETKPNARVNVEEDSDLYLYEKLAMIASNKACR